jgi:hypothetical protein
VFAYRRTPYLGLLFGAVIGWLVIAFLETPGRPMSGGQQAVFYVLSCLPGLGIAMFFDPAPRKAKAEYLKINYYAPGGPAAFAGAEKPGSDTAPGPAARERGRV